MEAMLANTVSNFIVVDEGDTRSGFQQFLSPAGAVGPVAGDIATPSRLVFAL